LNRTKLLIENFFSYGFISIISKVIPFIFLPIITRLLPDTSNFGVFNIFYIIVYLGFGFAFLGLYHPLFREYFEKDDQKYKDSVASTSFLIVFLNTSFLSLLLVCFHGYLVDVLVTRHVALLVGIALFVNVNQELMLLSFKIKNDRKAFLVSGLLNAISQKVITIILIILGFTYLSLIYAMIAANALTIVYAFFRNREFYFKGKFDKVVAKGLLKFGLPLIPVSIILWVNQSIDSMLILRFLDLSELGIYAIGMRVAYISHLIYLAFSIGWGYFANATMKDSDNKFMIGRVFSLAVAFVTSFYFIVFMFKDVIFNLLFTGDYVSGVYVFPYLLMGPLFMVLILILEYQIIVAKKPIYSLLIHGSICAMAVLANLILIPKFGIVGAGIATVWRYLFCMLFFMVLSVKIKKLIVLDKRVYWLLGIFLGLFVYVNVVGVNIISALLIICYLTMIFVIYYKQVVLFYKRWKN